MKWFVSWIADNKGRFVGLMIGLATAILFLTIGFWETVLIGICTGIGGYLGGHPEKRAALAEFVKGLFRSGSGNAAK